MSIYNFPEEEVEENIQALGFIEQLKSKIDFEVGVETAVCGSEIRKALGYNLPSIFDEVVGDKEREIKAGEIELEKVVINPLEKGIENEAEKLKEELNSARVCIESKLQEVISKGRIGEATSKANSTIELLNKLRPEEHRINLENIRDRIKSHYEGLKSALDSLKGWRKARKEASEVLSLLEKYERECRKGKEFDLKSEFVEKRIEFLENLIRDLKDFEEKVKKEINKEVSGIEDPHITVPSVEDLVIDLDDKF